MRRLLPAVLVALTATLSRGSRAYNVSFGGAPIKVDASDVSKFEREQRVTSVVIAPAERYVFEVMFDRSGTVQFMNVDTAYYAPIEWVDGMPDMNCLSTSKQVRWILRDEATGKENMDIDWRVPRGSVVNLRLFFEIGGMMAVMNVY